MIKELVMPEARTAEPEGGREALSRREKLIPAIAALASAGVVSAVVIGSLFLSSPESGDHTPSGGEKTWIGRTQRTYEDVTPTGTVLQEGVPDSNPTSDVPRPSLAPSPEAHE